MTSGPARVERLPVGRGDDPASTAAASPAVMAAQARLGELRRAMGYAAQPSAAELERAAKDAAWQRWAADLAARKKAKEAEAAADQAAARQRWQASLLADRADQAAAPVAPVTPAPASSGAPVDLYAEGERLRLAKLKESDPRAYYLETLPELPDYVRAYPSLLAAARKGRRGPHMRLYLLCKALDVAGSGVVALDQVRRYFVGQDAPYKAFGARRLRQILAEGRGVFWQRYTDDKLWLASPGRLAVALGVGRLDGAPVAVPVWAIWGGHHEAAAAFYSAWHAGRGDDPNPVGRAALVELTGAAASTQRTYDHTAEVQRQRNIAIVGDATKEGMQDAAWRFGRGVFKFRDHVGKMGRRGWVYAAASMPSTYHSKLDRLPRGRQRKANKLIRLVTNGARGKDDKIAKRYHVEAAAACDAYNHDPKHDHYWRRGPAMRVTAECPPKLAAAFIWGVVVGQ